MRVTGVMDAHQKEEGQSKTAHGLEVIDWGGDIFSTLRYQLLMEEFL